MWKAIFDRIADDYDQQVQEADQRNLFPFAGYDEVLTTIARYILSNKLESTLKILDLGIGTASLYRKLPPERIRLFGSDISEKMLERARLLVPSARLEVHDFTGGIPGPFMKEKFDFIVSTYAFHHLDLAHLIKMIDHLLQHLEPMGKILIGDVLFQNKSEREDCRESCLDLWDDNEHYHLFSELIEFLDGRLAISFLKISFCAGIIVIENYHETTLQRENNLLKYKSNTTKWKSSRARKTSD
jgi:putative AdoMet-dependent methyltransferase